MVTFIEVTDDRKGNKILINVRKIRSISETKAGTTYIDTDTITGTFYVKESFQQIKEMLKNAYTERV